MIRPFAVNLVVRVYLEPVTRMNYSFLNHIRLAVLKKVHMNILHDKATESIITAAYENRVKSSPVPV